MTTKIWNFTLEGQSHTLTVEHKWLSGKRTVVLDGQLLEHVPPALFASGSVHEYQVEGHSLKVVIQETFAGFVYDFLIDGVALDTGNRGPRRVGNTSLQGAAVLVVFMILIGLGVSWLIKSNYDDQLAIQEWPVVTGKIVSINTHYHPDNDDDDNLDNAYYHAVLTVEYVVGDTHFTSQIDDDQNFDSDGKAFASHAIGEEQMLYVNPANPQESHVYFEKMDPNGWVGTVLLVMGMFIVLSLIILSAVWFQTRNSVPVLERL